MDIYKIVVNYEDSLDTELLPRIYFQREDAFREARAIVTGGYYGERRVDKVTIYRETPDVKLGWYRTVDTHSFNNDNKECI